MTIHDYLLRNFNLFRLEATYEIREDITDVLGRVGGVADADEVRVCGSARTGLVFWARPEQLQSVMLSFINGY